MTAAEPAPEPVPVGRARKALLRRLIDYVSMPSSRVPPQDRSMAGDVLLDMLLSASDEDRKLCARRLSVMRDAPRNLLRYLAQCPFEIAQPVLEESEIIDESDFCSFIESVTAQHRNTIAARKLVGPVVSERLAQCGETHVVLTLLKNQYAVLSEGAIEHLVVRSREEEAIVRPLVDRPEVRPAQAMAMFWWADGATRREILRRYAADRLEMIEMCADVFPMAAAEGWSDPIARKTLQLIERRQRNRAAIDKSPYDSLEHAIEVAAKTGMNPEIAQEIGYLSGVKPVTIAKIMSDRGGEGLAVLCKATGLKRPYLKGLWLALRRPMKTEEGHLNPHFAYIVETYDLLTVAKAQTTLRYWNWSLSSSFSPNLRRPESGETSPANDDAAFSTSRRMASLVFGK